MEKFGWVILFAFIFPLFVLTCGDDDDDNDADDEDGGLGDDDDNSDDDDNAPGELWTDPASGLTWQLFPLGEYLTWNDANSYCQGLSDAEGVWRLPMISELRTLIHGCPATETGGSCGVTNSCLKASCQDASCSSCNGGDGPNYGCYGVSELPGQCEGFWSSSKIADSEGGAWAVYFGGGTINDGYVGDANRDVRCVRSADDAG